MNIVKMQISIRDKKSCNNIIYFCYNNIQVLSYCTHVFSVVPFYAFFVSSSLSMIRLNMLHACHKVNKF